MVPQTLNSQRFGRTPRAQCHAQAQHRAPGVDDRPDDGLPFVGSANCALRLYTVLRQVPPRAFRVKTWHDVRGVLLEHGRHHAPSGDDEVWLDYTLQGGAVNGMSKGAPELHIGQDRVVMVEGEVTRPCGRA